MNQDSTKYAIEVKNATVRFNMASEKVDNLKEYMVRLATHRLMFQEFLALKNINLQIRPGEAWGLVGANGAGKSTLLKLICGILTPYKGSVSINGSIAPLIELGAGFDVDLTGGENIFLNGALLGHSKEFMQRHYDEILEFSELRNFIDVPVKNYSSGMKARLGFAIATVVKPSILIVDEVLAVGDAAFQKKCTDRMDAMLSRGTTLLFVSHSVPQVRNLCTHALWLDHGTPRMLGEVNEVCDAYEEFLRVPVSARTAPAAPKHTDDGRYDYLVVGSGISGATFAYEAARRGKKVLVLERRDHVGGNCATREEQGIQVHRYGPHIFHTDDRPVWELVNSLTPFNSFVNCPVANFRGQLYNLPFNMNTFARMWGVTSPQQARDIIAAQQGECSGEPRNLEQQAIRLVGRDIYETLIKGYTEKQWGRPCTQLPPDIIRRLPVRYTYNNNYYNNRWQGVPEAGYTALTEKMLQYCEVRLNTDYLADKARWDALADRVVYTGALDAYFGSRLGSLEYRSLRFEEETLPQTDYQGVAVMNFTDAETPYTRVIEHRHFQETCQSPVTVVTREYPQAWRPGLEPYYALGDAKNTALCAEYAKLAAAEPKTLFLGRLARYTYLDMDKAVREAMDLAARELK